MLCYQTTCHQRYGSSVVFHVNLIIIIICLMCLLHGMLISLNKISSLPIALAYIIKHIMVHFDEIMYSAVSCLKISIY